jgi:chromosome segregation ATPase
MEEEKKEAQIKVETLDAQLKEWGIDLEKFRAKAGKTKTNVKVKLDNEVAALRTKMDEAQKKLEELKKAGGAASGELKKGIESAWAELKKAFDSAAAKFKRLD